MKSSVGLLLLVFFFLANKNNIVNACTTDEFECADGKCIDKTKRCDSDFDCNLPDRSDEINCTFIQLCPEATYKCATGECVNNKTECPIMTSIVSSSSTIAVDIQSSFVSLTTNSKLISATSLPNTFAMLSSCLSSTVMNNLQSSSVFISSTIAIEPTTTRHSYQTSVIQTTPTFRVKTPPTDDQKPDEESNKLLFLLLLLIPLVALIIILVCCKYRQSMRSMIYRVTRRGNNYHDASRNREMH